jgi:tetratricopeptide (TPR) repeat protein
MLRGLSEKYGAILLTSAVWLLAIPAAGYGITFNPGTFENQIQTTSPPLAMALRLLEKGQLAEAEKIARKVLSEQPNLAPAHEVLGAVLGTRGDINGAIAEFKRALELNPKQSSALTKLGDVQLALGHLDDARRNFEAALAIDPTDRQAHQRLGLLDERAGHVDSAIRHFEKGLVGTSLTYIGIKVNLALLYNQRGQFAKSRDLLERYATLKDHDPTMHRALANAYLGLGVLQKAVEQYHVALALAPKDVAALIGLGVAFRELGQKDKAVTTLAQAVRDAPDNSEAQIELARSRLAAGQKAQARQGLEKAHKRKPGDVRLSLALADLYVAIGEKAAGIAIYEAMVAAKGAPAAAYVSLGVIRQAEGNFAAGEKAFRGLLQAFPESSEPYFRLGALFGLQRRYQEALKWTNKGLDVKATDPRLLKAASVLHLRLGEKAKAVEKARALAAFTKRPDDQFFLATVLEETGDVEDALATYRAVIRAAPDNWAAMNNLAFLLASKGGRDAAEAVTLAKQAATLAPNQPTVTDTLGWSQLQAGNAAAATKTLIRAVQQAPKSAKFRYHLGRAQAAWGDSAAARQSLMQALTLKPVYPEAKQALEELSHHR